MHNDRIAAPERPPQVATGFRLVRAPVTVTSREVTIPVSPDLFWLCMPVEAVSYPAKNRNFTVEVGDCPKTVIVAGSTNVAVFLFASVSTVVATAIRLQSYLQSNSNGRSRGGLVKVITRGIEGDKDGLMLLIAIESIEGRLGGRRCFLVLRNDGVSNRVRLYSRKNERPALLRHQPARNVPETMGSGGPVPPISFQEILVVGARTYPDRRVVGSGSPGRAGEGTHRYEWVGTRRKGREWMGHTLN